MCACTFNFECGRCADSLVARDSLHQYESVWARYENEQRDLARAGAYMGYGLKVQR